MSNLNNFDDLKYERMKEDNEYYFLPDNEKVHYDSIIILEIFYTEDLNNLFDGLDLLYSNLSSYDKSTLAYRDILHSDEKKSFRGILYLPPIVNTKIKDRFLPRPAFHDLGDELESISITLQATLPSIVTLQIQASLDSNITNKINDIIYNYHKEVEEVNKFSDCEFTTTYPPGTIKNKEITEIRNNLKSQIIKFLSEYFEGFFFKQSNNHISYVPSIDLFSLNYPDKPEDISDWLQENCGFWDCFNITVPWLSYKYENYLLLFNSTRDKEVFPNYTIIANRKTAEKEGYTSIKSSIQYQLNHFSFEIFCYARWLDIEEKVGLSLSSLVSKELEYITKNDFNKVIANREVITKYIFYFEKFKVELKNYTDNFDKGYLPFKPLNKNDVYLLHQLLERINENINYIDEFINTLNRHSDNTLALKNIEYNKKMQNSVLILTLVIIAMTVVQIYLTLNK